MDFLMTTIFGLTAVAWWLVVAVVIVVPGLIFLIWRFLKAQAKLAWKETKTAAAFVGLPLDVKILPNLKKNLQKPKLDFKSFYGRFEEEIYKRTCWFMRCELAPFIKKGETVLDIGCGRGYIALEIQNRLKAKVTGVDLVDLGNGRLPVVIFDGVRLPFTDKSFDVAIFSYVLHHAGENQGKLLLEAKRVAKKKIIIFEDEAVGGFGELFTSFHRFAYDYLNEIKGNNRCLFHNAEEWEEIFIKMGLKILEKRIGWTLGSITAPVKRSFWVLEV